MMTTKAEILNTYELPAMATSGNLLKGIAWAFVLSIPLYTMIIGAGLWLFHR